MGDDCLLALGESCDALTRSFGIIWMVGNDITKWSEMFSHEIGILKNDACVFTFVNFFFTFIRN